MWNRIKQKTTYRVTIDTETLIKNCIEELKDMPPIPKAKLVSQTAEINIEQAEVSYTEKHIRSSEISGTYQVLPDIIRLISSETLLSRRTVNPSGRKYFNFIISNRTKSDFLRSFHIALIYPNR